MADPRPQPRHNLPVEPNSFIDRERDLSEITQLLGSSRLLTLCGVGGIGKTRLALRVATALLDGYRDGVWLVELADLEQGELVTARVTGALGIREEAGHALFDTLADALRSRRLLLVMDNCEHLLDALAPLCRRLLAVAPYLTILATSRDPLRISGETVWRVPPLSLPPEPVGDPASCALAAPTAWSAFEAVRLFTDRASAAHPDFKLTSANAPTVGRICRMLDGIPLAIELAAARVRVLTPQQIADRLTDRFALLRTGERTAPARQRTLRATVDWSYELLTGPERTLLARLSVFSGWSLELAESVCADAALPRDGILELLTALLDKSFVTVDREVAGHLRYRMLDTLRQYAAERLDEAGDTAVLRGRHRDEMLRLAEELARHNAMGIGASWAERVPWLDRAVANHDNLRSALSWCLERGDVAEGLRFSVALRTYWVPRGESTEGAGWADRFLAAAAGADPGLRGAALVRRAEMAFENDDREAAKRFGAEGLRLCREAGDHHSVTTALNILAMAELRSGDPAAAGPLLDESLRISRAEGDLWNEGIALTIHGPAVAMTGDLERAELLCAESLRIFRSIDHAWCVARSLVGLGRIVEIRGDLATAERHYTEALALLRSVNARPEIARCLSGLARLATARGDHALARSRIVESVALSHGSGQRLGVARGLGALAGVALREERYAEAARLAGAAAALRAALKHPAGGAGPSGGPDGIAAAAGAAIGEAAARQAWLEGEAMDVDAAVRYARRGGAEPAPPPAAPEPPAGTGPRRPAPAVRPAAPAGRPLVAAEALTNREREIARLVAGGLTNRSIAAELVISPATVARHIANILAKLGFRSRTEIAIWQVAQDAGAEPGTVLDSA
ncbi:helix-turn-helix transcriptional regulator [Allonocardiopsis opalescens]|uniref:Putative ATPase n=1 Tax=Allonocardiopsis opalescens TaxID=1144618 RepID=A0A2T0QE17_9ACTN|nr:LuxR C-terminal-related transcriptional regulator [Allonocardiopsis opalescens]PRY02155.1 putative ATPase [Allonocardiopsis opalescens]